VALLQHREALHILMTKYTQDTAKQVAVAYGQQLIFMVGQGRLQISTFIFPILLAFSFVFFFLITDD